VAILLEEQWQAIDQAIFNNLELPAINLIREGANCSLKEALDHFYQRVEKLQAESPDKFNCNLDEYWVGFYS